MQATDRTVYVGNVGKEVDDAALLALFGHCGTVTQIRIAGDPTYETRYAFIEFTTVEEATTALLLDGMNVFDRVIKVNMARGGSGPGVVRSLDPDRVQRTIHVGGLPFDEISEETLAEYFSHVGEVNAVRKSGRFAWVEFASLAVSQQALALDGESLGAGVMKVSQSKTPIHTAGWRAAKYRDMPLSAGAKSGSPPPQSPIPPAQPPMGAPPGGQGGPPPYPPPAHHPYVSGPPPSQSPYGGGMSYPQSPGGPPPGPRPPTGGMRGPGGPPPPFPPPYPPPSGYGPQGGYPNGQPPQGGYGNRGPPPPNFHRAPGGYY